MRPKLALVLGGGGSRGIAHIGVLQVLARHNVQIDLIVGTSMGAIVGAIYASGVEPDRMAEKFLEMQSNSIFNMNFFSARSRQRDIQKQLERALLGMEFADLEIPLIAMAVDVVNGVETELTEGPLIPALLASSAVPAVFPPVEIMNTQMADGGVIDSLATHVAHKHGAEKIIAVDVYPHLETDDPWIDPISAVMGFQLPFNLFSNTNWGKVPSMMSSMWRSFRVMAWHLHEERLRAHPPDILLRPNVHSYGSLDFTDAEGPLIAGREEAEHHLNQILDLVQSNQGSEMEID